MLHIHFLSEKQHHGKSQSHMEQKFCCTRSYVLPHLLSVTSQTYSPQPYPSVNERIEPPRYEPAQPVRYESVQPASEYRNVSYSNVQAQPVGNSHLTQRGERSFMRDQLRG